MIRNLSNDLSFPPRPASILVQLSVLFGGFNNQFGWIFTTIGLLMVGLFTAGVLEPEPTISNFFIVGGVGLVFLFIGVFFLRKGINQGLLARHLLINGSMTKGKIVSWEETNTRINDEPVIAYTFEYKTDGVIYNITEKTHLYSRLEDDDEEPILYDPRNPQDAIAIDVLPMELEVGRDGQLNFAGGAGIVRLVLQLLIPAICIAMILAYLAWELGYLFPADEGIQHLFEN